MHNVNHEMHKQVHTIFYLLYTYSTNSLHLFVSITTSVLHSMTSCPRITYLCIRHWPIRNTIFFWVYIIIIIYTLYKGLTLHHGLHFYKHFIVGECWLFNLSYFENMIALLFSCRERQWKSAELHLTHLTNILHYWMHLVTRASFRTWSVVRVRLIWECWYVFSESKWSKLLFFSFIE